MSTPYDEAPLTEEKLDEPGTTICPDCGEDLEWHVCGQKSADPNIEAIVRRVIDQLRDNCLSLVSDIEREAVILALSEALTRANAGA